jgi:peroxiredoxin
MIDEIEVGKPVPGFRLLAHSGGEAGPSDYLGKKALVLFFVREYN